MARASRSKRLRLPALAASSSRRTLIATSRFSRVSRARYTTPMPPAPGVASKRISQCAFVGCGSFCLLSLFESRQNADFRPELVVPAESHVVDHGFEIAVQAEDHAPLVEFALGAATGDLHAPLGTNICLAAQLLRTVLDHDLRPDEGHVRVPFLVEICIDHDPHDGPGVGVDRK